MVFTKEQLQNVIGGTDINRVEALRHLLGYPVKELDPQGSRFWYLRPGKNKSAAKETQPIAVGFYDELNQITDKAAKVFITSEEQQLKIYGHYTDRVSEDQPVMYILLPSKEETGRVALVLPTEGKLRQRQIQTFEWNSPQLLNSRLPRLHQDSLPIADKALLSTPLVEWVLYDSVATAKELAQRLAANARQIEEIIPNVYAAESENGYLHSLFASFRKELLPNLKVSPTDEKEYSFADIYAQTVAYGLFTARVFSYERNKDDLQTTEFNRQTAWDLLPETNPFLRRLFRDISLQSPQDLGDELIEAIVEIISYLRVAKMEVILRDFHEKINQEDIVIRFYEDFLAAYKPQMRERRGVYYTPEPVVSYMVRSVDILVKEKFNKPLGLADPEVTILDPACGTGTFLLWICQLIYQRFQESPNALTEGLADKSWSGYVKDRLLPRIFGFELLMAPYAIAHLKLGLFLEETGYKFDSGKRLGVYLTNTLEQTSPDKPNLPFEEFIAQEGEAALGIKRNEPIMLIIGNPPYSHSNFEDKWIIDLMKDYKKGLKEKKSDLNREEWKFLRFAQYKIDQLGQGIVSFVINNTFIDAITYRALRKNIFSSFSSINILDLHGSVNKNEKCPDGSKDENIFDIRQGVSIFIGSKLLTEGEKCQGKVKFKELYGIRENKYKYLETNQINTEEWTNLKPESSDYFFFCPKEFNLQQEYNLYEYCLKSIFLQGTSGIQTKRDEIFIDFDFQPLSKKIQDILCNKNLNLYSLESTSGWSTKKLQGLIYEDSNIKPYFFRPFDKRFIYYDNHALGRARFQVMKHLLYENISLCSMRQVVNDTPKHFFCVDGLTDINFLTNHHVSDQVFPLYIYPDINNYQQLEEPVRPNLSQNFLNTITEKLGYTPTPEAIFYYIYAIFHSPTYRTRYAEFLKIGFPRVPLTSDNRLFSQLATYGEELVSLHLMKSLRLDNFITNFVGNDGNNQVDVGHPKYNQGAVIINKKGDKFIGVPKEVWDFYVGGYQVCQKWLKDRKGRTLTPDDIQHYQRIVVALKETIELMANIDAVIPAWPIQ